MVSFAPESAPEEHSALALAGIGLRFLHHQDIVDQKPDVGWIEVHPENYFSGGEAREHLARARQLYPLSFHAVGLSLGSSEHVCKNHLAELRALIKEYSPFIVSDHVSWSKSGNAHLNDLMPLPYNQESLDVLCRNIDETQNFLGIEIAIENPSTYLSFNINTMTEFEFMNAACEKTGCGILLDVNNVFVQAHNHGFDANAYIDSIDSRYIREIHLAGHTKKHYDYCEETLLIDTHSKPVCEGVWRLYADCIRRHGPINTLIEWDADIPALDQLVAESREAAKIMSAHSGPAHAAS